MCHLSEGVGVPEMDHVIAPVTPHPAQPLPLVFCHFNCAVWNIFHNSGLPRTYVLSVVRLCYNIYPADVSPRHIEERVHASINILHWLLELRNPMCADVVIVYDTVAWHLIMITVGHPHLFTFPAIIMNHSISTYFSFQLHGSPD